MLKLIVRRLIAVVPLLVVISILTFLLVDMIPGGAAEVMLGSSATPANIRELNHQLGLDRPFFARFGSWLGGAIHGNFGSSIRSAQSVSSLIAQRMPATLSLVIGAMVLAIAIGLVFGLLAGMRAGSRWDRAIVVLTSTGLAIPSFWIAILFSVYIGVKLQILPAGGYVPLTESVSGWFQSLVLPWVALALASGAVITRQVRSSVIATTRTDYVRAAVASGLPRRVIVPRYILKNALTPVIAVISFQIVVVLGTSFVIEQAFNISALGSLAVQAVSDRDLPVVQGTVLVVACFVICANLLADLAYGWVNPRARAS